MRSHRSKAVWGLMLLVFGLHHGTHASNFGNAVEFVMDFVWKTHSSHNSVDDGPPRGMQVIGAGFSRTGTKSTEEALKRLGHKIYDTRSMLEHPGHGLRWNQAAQTYRKSNRTDLSAIEVLLKEMEDEGYTATLDIPINLFALQLATLRPEAKVVMTVRDTEEAWLQSWKNISYTLSHFICRPWKWLVGDMRYVTSVFETMEDFPYPISSYPEHIYRPVPWFEIAHSLPAFASDEDDERWLALHKQYQKRLEDALGNRLLLFNVKQGWAPLLAFLGIDDETLAQESFPQVNDRRSVEIVRLIMDIVAAGLPLIILLQLYFLYKLGYWCSRLLVRTSKKAKNE